MLSIGDLRRGITIEMDGQVYQVLEYQHVKMQQRAPVLRLKLRDIRTGRSMEKTIAASQKLARATVENRPFQYLYTDGDLYYFMDTQSYEQTPIGKDILGDSVSYLKEGTEVTLSFYKGQPMGIEIPITVNLKVVETSPGFKGDTAQAGTKPARLETGLQVNVPLFINQGDMVKVDTRTSLYVERVP